MSRKSHFKGERYSKLFILVILLSLFVFTIGSSAAPGEPTPPVTPTPPAQDPPAENPPHEFEPPVPGSLPPEVERGRAQAAMEEVLAKFIEYYGPRYQLELGEVTIEGEWAYSAAHWQSEAQLVDGPLHILAHRLPDNTWQALVPSNEGLYLQWANTIPDFLIPSRDILELQGNSFSSQAISTYDPPSSQNVVMIPGTVPVSPYIEEAIVEALEEVNLTQMDADYYAITDVQPLEDWLFVSVIGLKGVGTSLAWNLLDNGSWFGLVIVNIDETNHYSSALEGTQEFTQLLSSIPDEKLAPQVKQDLDPSSRTPTYTYNFPWDEGTAMQYGVSGVHDNGFPGPTPGWLAVDFLSDGNTGAGHAPNRLRASATGTISYKCTPGSGQNSTAVRIGDLMYTHLLNTGELYVGRYFSQNDEMGQMKSGSFTENCGYASQGSSWFHVHWGFPNTGTFEAGGWTLTISDELWRRGGETRGTLSWFTSDGDGTPPCNPNADQVALFVDANYNGQCVTKNIGDYPNPGSIGLPNDSISSVRVGSNVRAVLCRDDNYGGGCDTFTSDDPDLSNNGIGDNSVSSARVESTTGGCAPNSNEIALFADANYQGQCVLRGHGNYRNPGAIGLPNDSISSIRVGNNTVAVLCRDDNYAGTCEIFTGDDSNLSNNSVGNDSVSSAWADVNATSFKVLLYTDPDFQGGGCGLQSAGQANMCTGYNDVASSIRIMPGWSARVWQDSNFGGSSRCFTSSDPNFSDNTFENGSPLDNQISSFAAYNQSTCPPLIPNMPGNLTVTGTSQTSLNISWQDNSSNEDGFNVYHWNGSAFVFLASVGANITGYTHAGLNCGATYYYEVSAYNGAGESPHTPWASGTTNECSIVGPLIYDSHTIDDDTVNNSNGNNDGIVNPGETIELYVDLLNQGGATATGINATLTTADPHVTILFNTGSGYPDISGGATASNYSDWDFSVSASAPDGHIITFCLNPITASNGGPWSDCFDIPVIGSPHPDLEPAQWGGWQYPIVPSSLPGTNTVNTLYAGQPTYIDWGLANNGNLNTGGNTYGDLYIDGTLIAHYNFGDVLVGQSWAFLDWIETISTPGWHTLRVTVDPDNLIAESDETNNSWESPFYWVGSAPYSDNFENGVNDWTATGLWHQIDEYTSPYPESHSWSHSWWYGQDTTGNYDTGSANSGDLTSPQVYIPASGYYLRFWYWYETETYFSLYDQRWVQISVDGGPFTNVRQLHSDPMNEWRQSQAIDLSAYAGNVIQVRFRFDTTDSVLNNYRGWYVDDIEITTTPPPACTDVNEPNNIYTLATPVTYGGVANGDICPHGDYDFYSFSGVAGDKVVLDIDAQNLGSSLDSYIYLIDSNGTTVLAQNDDAAGSSDSKLGYTLPHDGTYYIKVRSYYHPNVGGPGHFYTLNLYTDNNNPSGQITAPIDNAWINPTLTTVVATLNDNESGVSHVNFFWHDADWANSDWIWLGLDDYSGDGWSWNFDTSVLPEQRGGAFYIYAYDWAANVVGSGTWNLGIDRTPPTVDTDAFPLYGDAPFRDFWVAWWNSSDNLSGIQNYDVQYRDGTGGTWTNLLTSTTDLSYRFVGENGHTYYFRSRARDNAGNQSSYAGGNGDVQYTVQICPVASDSYEPDNDNANASWIAVDGSRQTHNVHVEEDADWVQFQATTGITYTLSTTNTGGHADTQLYLYDTDGTTLIAFNDDYTGMWPSSRIDWQATANGTYYAKVDHWDPWAYGCTTEYGLSIVTNDLTPPTGSITINGGDEYTNSPNVVLTLPASDTGTGVEQMMLSNVSGFPGATWTPYATPFNWTLSSGNGLKTVYVMYRDHAGNVSAVYQDSITLDAIGPQSTASSPSYDNQNPIPVSWTASDTLAPEGVLAIDHVELWVKIGTGSWNSTGMIQNGNSGIFNYSATNQNNYCFATVATDVAGNQESLPTGNGDSCTIFDTSPPQSIASSPAYANAPFEVEWTASDNLAGIDVVELWVKVGAGNWAATGLQQTGTSGTFDYAPSSQGTYCFATMATDLAGNSENTPTGNGDSCTIFDTSLPQSTASSPPYDNQSPILVDWTANDTVTSEGVLAIDHVELWVKVGTGSWTATGLGQNGNSGTFSYSASSQNNYCFATVATDTAGNQEPPPTGNGDSCTTFDIAPPQSTANSPEYANTSFDVGWTADDNLAGVDSVELWIKIGNSAWVDTNMVQTGTSGTFSYSATSQAVHCFATVAVDSAGNIEASPTGEGDSCTVFDTTPPVSSVSTYDQTTNQVQLDWTASDNLSGVNNVTLWVCFNNGSWQNAGLPVQTGTSGAFVYAFGLGTGTYAFATTAVDYADNDEGLPTVPDVTVIFEEQMVYLPVVVRP